MRIEELQGYETIATKADIKELELFILDREVKSIRWMVGTQIAYFAITLSAVYFLLHFK